MMYKIFNFFNPRFLWWSLKNFKIPKNVILKYKSYVKNVVFEGNNVINKGCKIINCEVGKGTYFSINSSLYNSKIGRFCSVGRNLSNSGAQHPSSTFVSTHPSFYSTKKQAGFTYAKEQLFDEHILIEEKYQNIIGNDVWIGNNVTLMEGVSIGDGAIIASGSIVTKDVPSYAIYAGVPARLIKYRFNEKQIKFLIEFKWWDKSNNWLKENLNQMSDINNFYDKFK